MSEYNIPIIEPAIDYTKVPPINQKRTIAFINHFISQTATFLNKFALSCEEKLFECENKLQRVEASLELLESRISSISGLENENLKSKDTTEIVKNEEQVKEPSKPVDETDQPPESPSHTVEQSKSDIEMQPISLDPTYEKYFKMLHFGVPKPAVKIKMKQEGLDSSILDNPDKLVPKVTIQTVEENTSS